ncbi:MAG: YncE family protein [Candidatus Krumholzibacteria bacterium]|nr:YncE family protein [Candidatus Krumholzibacteria bacterium]MDH4337021.1 YncE family protein [Candidatus Krumholzibacteria bacterium]MDH5268558.1 YncE family protein [Candidatus Krumholzibacteria bacterium]
MRLTRSIIAAVACSLLASAAAAAPRILVVCRGDATLKAFDATSYQPLFSVKLPGEPHEVAVSPDGRFAYTADYLGLDNTVSIIDLEKQQRVADVNVKPSYKPHGFGITRDGTRLYVTCEASRAVVELDPAARSVRRTFAMRDYGAHLLTLSPDEKWIYASSIIAGTVSFINLETGELDRTVMSGQGCEGIAAAPDGSEIWSVNRLSQTISVIKFNATRRDTTMSAVGNPIRIRFTHDGSTAIVTCALTNQLALFDREQRKETGRVVVGDFPLVVEISPDGKRWFVTNNHAGSVSVVDAATREQVSTFPAGESPEGIVYIR